MQLSYVKTSFQYEINSILNGDFGFSVENGRSTLRDFRKSNKIRREGQSNKICGGSRMLSVRCRVRIRGIIHSVRVCGHERVIMNGLYQCFSTVLL